MLSHNVQLAYIRASMVCDDERTIRTRKLCVTCEKGEAVFTDLFRLVGITALVINESNIVHRGVLSSPCACMQVP
jgi:hypothetical protein